MSKLKKSIYFENLILSSAQLAVIKRRYQITDDFKSCDFGIFVDPLNYPKKASGLKILYLHEPEPVRPDLYTKSNLKKYDHIITISKTRAARVRATAIVPLPIQLPKYKKVEIRRDKLSAIINEHKFSASPRGMYGLRRKVIVECEKKGIPLDIFGQQWSDGYFLEIIRRRQALRIQIRALMPISFKEVISHIFHNYSRNQGPTESSDCQELLQYKTSIVIENDLDYVSEKIWKSLYAGSIPIYVGPVDELDSEIKSAIIECKPSVESIIEKLQSLDEKILIYKRKKAKEIIESLTFKRNFELEFAFNLVKFIEHL